MPKKQVAKIGGNKAKGRQHSKNAASGYYKQRFAITERNRKRKLTKHLSLQPHDRQALAALKRDMLTRPAIV